MFIANLNDNNDSLICELAGNRLSRSAIITSVECYNVLTSFCKLSRKLSLNNAALK